MNCSEIVAKGEYVPWQPCVFSGKVVSAAASKNIRPGSLIVANPKLSLRQGSSQAS